MSISADTYTIIERRILFDNARVRVISDILEHHGRRFPYLYLASPVDAVATVALTADRHIVLTRQYRHPVGAVIYDLPAGRLTPSEDPQTGALRELEEETGYRAGRMVLLGKFNPFPGTLKVTAHLFFATDLIRTVPSLDEGEELEIVLMPFADVRAMVLRGECIDGALQLGVLLAAQKGLV